ncbi:MAG: Dabb family protein [Iamia sp.]
MLTHIVLVTIADHAPEAQVQALVDGLRALPDQIPEIGSYQVDRDLGLADGNAGVAIVARFASPEDLATYIAHPAHVAAVRDLLDPISPSRVRIQVPAVS